ncbi:MAG: nucleoside deaminase [Aquificae bacterium]|nr:nucleoside deaminase [Aquificota bacterium]
MSEEVNHKVFLEEAYREALKSLAIDEVPVGAVVVLDGKVVGRGHNRRIVDCNAVHHAEIVAIQDACRNLRRWRLDGAVMYITNEPCLMCAGAVIHSRINKVYFASLNEKMGAVISNYRVFDQKSPYRVEYGYIPDGRAEKLLKEYFSKKREKKKVEKGSVNSVCGGGGSDRPLPVQKNTVSGQGEEGQG